MTTPPLHNTDEQRVDDALALVKYAIEYAETHGGCPPRVKAVKREGVAEAKSAILSLLAEAEKRGRAIGQYQAANNMYGDITSLWMLRKNPPDLFTLESLLKTCEGTLNDNQDTYKAYLAALRQKESKDERS